MEVSLKVGCLPYAVEKQPSIPCIQTSISFIPTLYPCPYPDVVRDLGVLLDNTLSMTNHISSVTKSCFFHLRRIRQIKRCLNEKCPRTLVQALVISRLDYCNSILINLPDTTLHLYTMHYPPQCCTTRQMFEAKGSHQPSSSATSLAFPSKREFHSKSVSSCSTSIPGHLRVTCHPWSCRAQSRIESLLVCQRRLRNPAHVQLIWSTGVRRCWFIRVEQSPGLPSSRAIYRIIQNQTKNSSSSNLLWIIILSGHCALNNVKRFRIRLVYSYRRSKKTVVLYCIGSFLEENRLFTAIHDPKGTYLSIFQRMSVCIHRTNTINCIMWKLQCFWRMENFRPLGVWTLEVRD